MTALADTPMWPLHGTVWGHLISDTSHQELHRTAARAGLPPRSFDLDHYDWPASARSRLEAAGVRFVDNRELTRRLIASGLRIPLRDRPAARARRSAEHAAQLGLSPVPRDLVLGRIGHAETLPAAAGAVRITRDDPSQPARIDAHDAAGRSDGAALLERLDELSRARWGEAFVGQVLEVPLTAGQEGPTGAAQPTGDRPG